MDTVPERTAHILDLLDHCSLPLRHGNTCHIYILKRDGIVAQLIIEPWNNTYKQQCHHHCND